MTKMNIQVDENGKYVTQTGVPEEESNAEHTKKEE